MRILGAILVVFLSVGSSGCWSFRKKAPQLPPLDPPVNKLPAPAPPLDLPPEATTPVESEPPPQPPQQEVTVIKPEPQSEPENGEAKTPVKPAARKPAPSPPLPGAPTATPPAVGAPEAAAAPPQLAELIEGDRRLELQREIDQSLDRAKSALMAASQRSLTRKQSETVSRVKIFIKQAEDARSRDISTAHQLARRADLLAQDLSAALN